MYRGIGMRARRLNKWFDAFDKTSESMFAREIRRGWATRFPVITEMVVLSEDSIVPKRAAPAGIWLYPPWLD